ncbi:hypothetical protein V1264_008372 [Littorina saxatilis]|uniref:Uncharacterized protein n=2 Tax=Littorina saxatilis TaxID=31220 RepID=A0AAN9G2N3_9CAEN
MSRFFVIMVALLATFTSADPVMSPADPVDIKTAAKQIVSDARNLANRAKGGINLDGLLQDVRGLELAASDLSQLLPDDVSECETNLVVKMAAAGTGSHEVLTVLLADDPLSVLSGRLSLSLAFLEHVAQQLEDELALSNDIGGHLMAVVFGTKTTAGIIQSADKTVKAMTYTSNNDIIHSSGSSNNRVRRQSVSLGSGWSLGLGGVKWQNGSGSTTFNVKPTFKKFKLGVQATLTIRF